eukprot:3911772-Prymnesium_polylepis.2
MIRRHGLLVLSESAAQIARIAQCRCGQIRGISTVATAPHDLLVEVRGLLVMTGICVSAAKTDHHLQHVELAFHDGVVAIADARHCKRLQSQRDAGFEVAIVLVDTGHQVEHLHFLCAMGHWSALRGEA